MIPTARFDDLVADRSFELHGYVGEHVAWSIEDVVAAVRAAEAAAGSGAWVAGFVAYEAAAAFDAALTTNPPAHGLPLAWFGVFEASRPVEPPAPAMPPSVDWALDTSRDDHGEAVRFIKRLIGEGVTYQVNLTHRLRGTVADPASLYAAMLHGQRPAYGALLAIGGRTVASASPELFFAVDGDRVVTRPMKGTAARGRWTADDAQRRSWLADSEKNRAENLMIVDLLRNDLGRIAEFGSVGVDSLFDIERYETVWQMTSTISAKRRPNVGLTDVFAALFPCGSVTGAPKASTMAVIRDIEGSPRGVYCGAIGFIEPGADRAVFSVPIRTVVVEPDGRAVYGTGGGITWDSAPDGEWREAEMKARVLAAPRPKFTLLETIRLDPNGFHLLDGHLDRLAASARYFGWDIDLAGAVAALDSVPTPAHAVVVRLTVDRHGVATTAMREVAAADGPVRLAIDPDPIDRFDPFRFHKTTHREMYEASKRRFPDADDVVSVDERGRVVETTVGNLVVRIDGRWLTPPLDTGCLPGLGRQRLIDSGAVEERPITVAELTAADGIEVVNSVRGRRRAVLLPDPAQR